MAERLSSVKRQFTDIAFRSNDKEAAHTNGMIEIPEIRGRHRGAGLITKIKSMNVTTEEEQPA
jgi:hypothetical protein